MTCPYCSHDVTEVVETRDSEDTAAIRRRRECVHCFKRFTTYERVETVALIVLKNNGSRESFNREKLTRGILKACEKTSISFVQVEQIVAEIERELRGAESIEIQSQRIGALVAQKLKEKDKVAYIRFASVFQRFMDLEEFEKEVRKLLNETGSRVVQV